MMLTTLTHRGYLSLRYAILSLMVRQALALPYGLKIGNGTLTRMGLLIHGTPLYLCLCVLVNVYSFITTILRPTVSRQLLQYGLGMTLTYPPIVPPYLDRQRDTNGLVSHLLYLNYY